MPRPGGQATMVLANAFAYRVESAVLEAQGALKYAYHIGLANSAGVVLDTPEEIAAPGLQDKKPPPPQGAEEQSLLAQIALQEKILEKTSNEEERTLVQATIRTLQELGWSRDGDVLTGHVRADAFCHHMVRSLVGCLIQVGEGKRPVGWPAEILAAGVREPGVPVAPAHGLTLEEVGYPEADELAAQSERARAKRELG